MFTYLIVIKFIRLSNWGSIFYKFMLGNYNVHLTFHYINEKCVSSLKKKKKKKKKILDGKSWPLLK